MKKIYTLLSLMLIGSAVVAQTAETTTVRATTKKAALDRATSGSGSAMMSAAREDVYTEDFDGGIPDDWEVFTESGPCTWEWTDVGHQGEFPSPSLESTTAGNGWMILDSDLCGADLGDTEVSYLTSPSIDLSAYEAVSVRFEQYFRRYGPAAEVTSLEVSIDGGDSWTSFEFNANVDQEGTPNPDIAQLNISDLAAQESDVRFRFRWEGTWGYGWQIDDFAVFTPQEYDLTLSATNYQIPWISENEENWRDIAYSVYPISQVRDMTFTGTITNNGGVTQNNVALQVMINTEDYFETLTSDAVTLAPAETVVLEIPDYTPPAEVGEYTVTYSTIQDNEDSNPDDNESMNSFRISEAEYARDLGISQGEFSNFDDDYKLGTAFYMESEEILHCLGVALSSSSVPGTSYNMELLDGIELAYIGESVLSEVPGVDSLNEPGDSNWEWMWMDAPVVLTEGGEYVPALNHFGGEDVVMARLSGTSPAQSSYIYEGSEETWYYITSTPMIRMGLSEEFCFSVVTDVDEIEQASVNELFPNPTSGNTTLEYSLLEAADVQLMVFDNMGRIVMQEDKGRQPVGEYRFDYDFSHLSSGMYTFSIRVGDKSINKKLVIK